MPLSSGRSSTPEFVSIADAAAFLKVDRRTVYRYISQGHLTAHRIGPKLLRIDYGDLKRLATLVPTAHAS